MRHPPVEWFSRFLSRHRKSHHNGEEPRVPLQPPGAGARGAGEDPVGRDPGGAGGLDLCPARASGEAGNRHEAGDGEKVDVSDAGALHTVTLNYIKNIYNNLTDPVMQMDRWVLWTKWQFFFLFFLYIRCQVDGLQTPRDKKV